MFDPLMTWLTPERRARLLFPVEIALASLVTIAALLNAQWPFPFEFWLLSLVVCISTGLAVAFHRTRPSIALGTVPIFAFALVLEIAGGFAFNGWAIAATAIAIFGAAAHGQPATRWVALGFSVLSTTVIFVSAQGGIYVEANLTDLLQRGASLVAVSAIALLPWVLGELVRSIRNRRQLSATVASVSTQRDAALTRADLEAERTRVARDVHDIVAHSLTVVIAQADGARYATAGDSPAAADAFETIAQTARDALGDVRVLLTELRHTQEAGPQPGLGDLDALLQSMRDLGLALEVREFGDRGRLSETRELALYRIVQESLTNALRHGDGAATFELEWGDQAVDLVVTNTAAGVTPESKEGGHGIDGMRERASLAGGELSVHEGAVFRVRARLPLEPRTADGAEAVPVEAPLAEALA